MNKITISFKRNQIELALWQLFNEGNAGEQMPQAFRTRIKRLLDLDRTIQVAGKSVYAFQDKPPEGRGVEVPYSAFDCFCLAVGLDLLDIGFKQAEVVFVLQHIRGQLQATYNRILCSPPAPPNVIAAADRPLSPKIKHRGRDVADCRVYLLIRRVEFLEAWPEHARSADHFILEPEVAFGIEELKGLMATMGFGHRKVVVLELAEAAVMLGRWLEVAPLKKRGR